MDAEKFKLHKVRLRHFKGFAGTLIAVIAIFLVLPLFTNNFYAHVFLQSCFVLLILSIAQTINRRKGLLLFSIIFVVPFICLDLFSILQDSLKLMLFAYLFYVIFVLIAIITLFKRVIKSLFVDTNLIFGAITIYLLAGVFWSKLYFLTDGLYPNSFRGIVSLDISYNSLADAFNNQFNLLYYSFATLATLGVGDITPSLNLAKSLTILEAMFGQLFIATVIAKTVTIWHQQSLSGSLRSTKSEKN